MDGNDVGVVELPGDLGLLDEAYLLALVALVEEVLDGHLTANVAIDGTENGPHAAAANLALEEVALAAGGALAQKRRQGRPVPGALGVLSWGHGQGDADVEAGLSEAATWAVDGAGGESGRIEAGTGDGQGLLAGGTAGRAAGELVLDAELHAAASAGKGNHGHLRETGPGSPGLCHRNGANSSAGERGQGRPLLPPLEGFTRWTDLVRRRYRRRGPLSPFRQTRWRRSACR